MKYKFLIILSIIFTINFANSMNIPVSKGWFEEDKINEYTLGEMETAPKYIVIHQTRAHTEDGKDYIEELKNTVRRRKVSFHYFIDIKGNIHHILDDKYKACHAGSSFWNGDYSLNHNSIGIEILTTNPFTKGISRAQYKNLIALVKDLMKKYNIPQQNILGHSDIGIFDKNKMQNDEMSEMSELLNRKQDPSHLFSWKILAKNGVGLWYNDSFLRKELKKDVRIQFYLATKSEDIKTVREKLNKLGYKINVNDKFDMEFYMASIVFHRRFFPQYYTLASSGYWSFLSTRVLDEVLKSYNIK